MKTKLKSMSKRTLSILLVLLMVVSRQTVSLLLVVLMLLITFYAMVLVKLTLISQSRLQEYIVGMM